MDPLRTQPPAPEQLAEEVAWQLVRAFAAVDHWRREVLGELPTLRAASLADALAETLAERLHDFAFVFDDAVHNDLLVLLPEAIDNLGCGETLDPDRVPAFTE